LKGVVIVCSVVVIVVQIVVVVVKAVHSWNCKSKLNNILYIA